MKKSPTVVNFFTLLLFAGLTVFSTAQAQIKLEGNTVTWGDVRFTFMTPTSVRMQYVPGGDFADLPSIVVQKRDFKLLDPRIEAWRDNDGWLVIRTAKMFLHYKLNSGRFTKDNLNMSFKGQTKPFWTPADSDKGNLGGISASLDGLRKDRITAAMGKGILNRSGTTLIDDSRSPLWDESTNWIKPRFQRSSQDWFFFYYGSDYTQMLRWFAELCGPIPMIPRYTFGAWITDLNYEYLPGTAIVDKYKYDETNVKKIVERFRNEGVPLDVLVLDYAWHKFGWKGGYDWSPVFPQPKAFLDWAHNSGLKISLNDHPGYEKESVLSDEDSHALTVRSEMRLPKPEAPTYSVTLDSMWKFKTDPSNVGVNEKWFDAATKDDAWTAIKAGKKWESQGFTGYDGVAWYRQSLSLPVNVPFGPLYIIFGGVDDEYDLYINGALVKHHGSATSSVHNVTTWTEVGTALRRGEVNLIALRVIDHGGSGGLVSPPFVVANKAPVPGIRFNLANQSQAQTFMDILHKPLVEQGVDFWWVDGGSGSAEMEGLNAQLWTNKVFYDYTQEQTKKRGFIFSRYGGLGNHRYPALFTGDTYAQWEVLAYQVPFTAQGGNVLMPYITHDIGGFIGANISFDLYARWVQFGVFSPFLRMHSAHENPEEGNVRMPWTYGEKGMEFARKFFSLRTILIPYIYTYSRYATDQSLPLVRPMYLEYPSGSKSYSSPYQYMFGKELLVAPVVDSSGMKEVYLPNGEWFDYFTGQKYTGEKSIKEKYPLDRMPVFVKGGAIIPMQTNMQYSDQRPLDTLVVDVYGSQAGSFNLYEDDGISLDYKTGKYAWTPMAFSKAGKGELTVGPTKGEFNGQPQARAYEVRFHGVGKPASVTVNGRKVDGWKWDKDKSVAIVPVESTKIRETVKVTLQ
jgi:alpha-glucosidase (family GH31 glycosyl hydrolase)